MPVEYVGSTPVASRLLRYTVKPKPGQTAAERVLHVAGQHCRPETAEREFARTRRKHGTQGAMRTSPAKFELPEPGEIATHLRKTRPNGRRVWEVAKDNETATHVRREGHLVRQAEGRHLITSFGVDEVNPDDPEQVALAFQYVVDRHRALYPGEQSHFVGQSDGAGRAFHVHTTRNATLFADMEVDGKLYRAGSKLAGELTDVDKIRERSDAFLAEHGSEYGLGPQRLPPTAERKRETRNSRDRRMATRGEKSNHDTIRDAFEDSLDDPRSVDLDSFVEVMREHGAAVIHRVTRAGKPGEKHALSYRLPEMPQNIRGTSLGEYYAFDSAISRLEANAAGLPREPRPERFQAGRPRPVDQPTAAELAEARAAVSRLAADERAEQISDQMARDYFPALAEDFDAATRSERTGDHETLAKLAHAGREREAAQKNQPPTEPTNKATATTPESNQMEDYFYDALNEDFQAATMAEARDDRAALKRLAGEYRRRRARTGRALTNVDYSLEAKALPPQLAKPLEEPRRPASREITAPRTVTVTEQPFVSSFRGLKAKNPRAQELFDAVALFDETSRAALLRGELLVESEIPKGVGTKFLAAQGARLYPLVFEQLQLREDKKKFADAQDQKGARATKEFIAMGERAEKQGDVMGNWRCGKDAQELASERDLANRRRDKLRAQIAAGDYETVSDSTWARFAATQSTEIEHVPERETRSL